MDYGLDNQFKFLVKATDFCLLVSILTGRGAHGPGHDAGHSSPSNGMVKNVGVSLPPPIYMSSWCSA
jgi:hypothetical protein